MEDGVSSSGDSHVGLGLGLALAGDGHQVFGGGLVTSLVPIGSSELFRAPLGCKGLCVLALRTHPPPHPQLVLYCHLHGSATSNLSISYVTNSTKHLMRERTGDLGSSWVRERVDFNVTDPFKVGWCCAEGSWAAWGQGPQLPTGAASPPKPTVAVPAHTVHPCQPQHRPCPH